MRTIILVINIFLIFSCAPAQDSPETAIRGTVVDSNGMAVVGANVYFQPQNGRGVKHTEVFTDIEGRFTNRDDRPNERGSCLVFVSRFSTVLETLNPVYPPFWPALRTKDKRFAGTEIRLGSGGDIDLGKIQPLVFWPVELFVLKKSGKPFYATLDDWDSRFILIVRDADAKETVGSSSVSRAAIERGVINVKSGSVMIELPEGSWTLEWIRDWDDIDEYGNSRRYLARANVKVQASTNPIPVRMFVGVKKK